MTMLTPQTGDIPKPYPTAISQPYWDGLRRGELLLQRCGACTGISHTPAVVCAHCNRRDQLTWERIPAAWSQVARDLDRDRRDGSRALILPGQLFASALARAKGLDPDEPAHLTKVTIVP